MDLPSSSLLFLKLTLLTVLLVITDTDKVLGCYTSIFSFGDSLTDTGNILYGQADNPSVYMGHRPYGETYFHRPTGRSSDGRLIVDFIAQSVGLPLLPPYLGHTSQDFRQGVNFAVAGATALDASFFEEKTISCLTKDTLSVQMGWFKQLLPSLCDSSSSCRRLLRNSLFLVGEVGGNDYNQPFFLGRSVAEIRTFVPKVIDAISSTINMLIQEGAVTLLVPGNLPIGCSASYLTLFQSSNKDDYDAQTGCINWLNQFAKYHNHLLQKELNRLRELHPHATIIYADYYNAAMPFYRFPDQLGFTRGGVRACCGGGGPYNYNLSARCGYRGSNACDDPSLYVSWDGLHLTEAAYKWMATGLLKGLFTIPHVNISCISLPPNVDEYLNTM